MIILPTHGNPQRKRETTGKGSMSSKQAQYRLRRPGHILSNV
jgi:hypothetical protein